MRKGSKHSLATIIKMSLAKKGKPSPKKGTHLSKSTKMKLRLANLGKKHSPETIELCRQKALKMFKDRPELRKIIGEASKGHIVTQAMRNAISAKNSKENSPHWKGGRCVHKSGYVMLRVDGHPNADRDGYVKEHRVVMERHIGRYLTKDEVVHHKNHKRDDNRICNLEIMSRSEHSKYHRIHSTPQHIL